MKRLGVLLAFTLSVAATPALAGIADTPLPVLVAGQPTYHLYSVPGVIRGGGMETFFSCTSTDTATMQVGVEIFGSAGGAPVNDATAESLSVGPGGSVVFSTGPAVWIGVNGLVPAGSKGSARILATS